MVLCSTLRVRKEGADGEKLHVRARYYSDLIVSIIMLLVGIGIGITAWLGSSQLNWDFMLCGFLFLLALINVLSGLRGLIYDARFEDLIVDKANGTMTRATFGMFGQARQESDVPLSEITSKENNTKHDSSCRKANLGDHLLEFQGKFGSGRWTCTNKNCAKQSMADK